MSKFFKFFVRDERGVSSMEYAILAGLVVVALGALTATFNTNISNMFTGLFGKVTAVTGT